jgi:hypothetical protein
MPPQPRDGARAEFLRGGPVTDLPKCPTCGRTVELFTKESRWAGTAEIRCVGHHRIGTSYSPGSKETAKRMLIEKWEKLDEEKL